MTRGLLIGEIIDNLSNLNNQVKVRCSLGLTDLNKVSEDFFAKFLNLLYGYNLSNLNALRSNEPGLDLGDEGHEIAYQVTSQSDSAKINSTFEKITDDQHQKFKKIKILIVGEKQGSYTAIKPELIAKFQYTEAGKTQPEDFLSYNLVDIKDLLRDMMGLDIKEIHDLYKFIKEEIQDVYISLEVPRADGSYPTSLLANIEVIPETKAKNAKRVLDLPELNGLTLKEINDYFTQLAAVPRVTREIYYFIIARGEFYDDTFNIHYDETLRILNISDTKLNSELKILERKNLIYSIDEEDPKLTIKVSPIIGDLLTKAKANLNLRKLIVSLDFTELDK